MPLLSWVLLCLLSVCVSKGLGVWGKFAFHQSIDIFSFVVSLFCVLFRKAIPVHVLYIKFNYVLWQHLTTLISVPENVPEDIERPQRLNGVFTHGRHRACAVRRPDC